MREQSAIEPVSSENLVSNQPLIIVLILLVVEVALIALLSIPGSPLRSTGEMLWGDPINRFYLAALLICFPIFGGLLAYDRALSGPVIIGLLGLAIGIAGWSLPPPLWQFLGYILPFLAIAISAVALILWWNTGRRVFRLIAKTSSLERDLRRIHETLDDSSKRIDDQIKMVRGVKDEAEKKEEMYEKVKRMVG
jgi:hypothetical protein